MRVLGRGYAARGGYLPLVGALAPVAVLVGASLAPIAPAAASAAGKATIKPRHGKPFVPQLGDWEGTVDGFPASFELLSKPAYASRYHLPPYGFEDLVMLEPNSCPVDNGHYFEEFVAEGAPSPVRKRGSFGLSSLHLAGGLIAARRARISAMYDSSAGTGTPGCKARLSWKLHPAQRHVVQDGTWQLRFADGETEKFTVRAGGRVATAVGLPSAFQSCSGPVGGVDLFIRASGAAVYHEAGHLDVKLRFARRSASGAMKLPGSTCANARINMRARYVGH